MLEIKAEAERIGIDPRQEHDKRFGEKPPTPELLQEWLNELKEMESQPPERPQDEPREASTWEEFWKQATIITGYTNKPDVIAGMLGVRHMGVWTGTLEEGLEELRKLCKKG